MLIPARLVQRCLEPIDTANRITSTKAALAKSLLFGRNPKAREGREGKIRVRAVGRSAAGPACRVTPHVTAAAIVTARRDFLPPHPSSSSSIPARVNAFVLAAIMAPQPDAAQRILTRTLLTEGFETSLIASNALVHRTRGCQAYHVQGPETSCVWVDGAALSQRRHQRSKQIRWRCKHRPSGSNGLSSILRETRSLSLSPPHRVLFVHLYVA